MELRALEIFLEVARSRGFSAAAHRLHSTQPTVSRIVKQLEEDLGHSLIDRDNSRLTGAGKVVRKAAVALLADAARLRADLDELKGIKRGELTLGLAPLGNTLFLPLVKAFKRRYPGIELRLLEGGSLTFEASLASGEVELATLLLPVDTKRFNSVPVVRDRLALVAPVKSPWSKRRFVRLRDLAAESFILFPSGFALNDRILVACATAGFTPRIAGYNGQWQFIVNMVQNGLGIALLPSSVLRGNEDVTVLPLREPVLPWELDLAWPRGVALSPSAEALIAMI